MTPAVTSPCRHSPQSTYPSTQLLQLHPDAPSCLISFCCSTRNGLPLAHSAIRRTPFLHQHHRTYPVDGSAQHHAPERPRFQQLLAQPTPPQPSYPVNLAAQATGTGSGAPVWVQATYPVNGSPQHHTAKLPGFQQLLAHIHLPLTLRLGCAVGEHTASAADGSRQTQRLVG